MNKILPNHKIFVAGALGMVGKSLVKELKNNGYGLTENGGKILVPDRSELNLLNQNLVQEWFEYNKPDIVILAAAKVGGIYANANYPFDFISENLKIQTNVIEASWKNGVKRFLFLGSSCIYPKFAKNPIREESLLQGSLEKTNEWYAIAKIAGIKLCQALRIQHGFDAISLMPTNLYGPGDNYDPKNSHVLAAMLERYISAKAKNLSQVTCWGTGNPKREFLHSEDLANACIFALEKWDPTAENAPLDENNNPLTILNVGTGKDISIKDLSVLISELVGFKGITNWDTSKPDGTPRKNLNISKISQLGWKSSISLKNGLERTINELSIQKQI